MKTHFLSFTESEITAYRFGLHCDRNEQVEDQMQTYREYDEDGSEWHFAIIEINTRMINWNEMAPGVFEGTHLPSLLKFKKYPGICSVMLFNVSEAVKPYTKLPDYDLVMSNGRRDKELLVLPTTPTKLNNHKIEYTGILDGYFISHIRKFIKGEVQAINICNIRSQCIRRNYKG